MSYNPYKIVPAVLVAVINNNKVILGRRVGTGYMDGWYGLPGGHLEDNESLQDGAVREAREEAGVKINPADLELFHIYQNLQKDTGRQYIGFIFRARKWEGSPKAADEWTEAVDFFDLDELPGKMIDYQKAALLHINGPSIKTTYTQLDGQPPA
jgi:ADP-ribose pyrophosphatase YjhB (NUDIX family)